MESWIEELKNKVSCEVRTDAVSRAIYSTDASIFEISPTAIVIPRTKQELVTAIQIAQKAKVPITARGAATGISGSCLGTGLIIDFSKHLTRILEIDIPNERVRVEPGVIQDDLNAALAPYGYRLGPDTSTGNRATIGGMVGNNAAGAHALKFGRMIDHVEELELILADGSVAFCKPLSTTELLAKKQQGNFEGQIYKELDRIRAYFHDEIAKNFPKVERRASGYNLNELIKQDFCNLSKLIVGSQGTLGVISEITLSITRKPQHQALVLIHTDHFVEGIRKAHSYLEASPFALELIDRKIIEAGRKSPSMQGKLSWLQGTPEALIVVEFENNDPQKLHDICTAFATQHHGKVIVESSTQQEVWGLRKAGLGLLLSQRSMNRAIAFIEDIVVPPQKLASFIDKLIVLLHSFGKEAGIYGHLGDGCLHIRPYMNLYEEKEKIETIMRQVALLVKEFGGSLSAEHGDGRLRAWLNPLMYGDTLYKAFQELKATFDPENLFNPFNIVTSATQLTNLKKPPKHEFTPFLSFEREGGFSLAADLCNGNGQCRKNTDLMCPSFQATHDEKDSTRARANAFRALLQGTLPENALYEKDFHEVMDLCIQCKGCKKECPSQVDMAKIKSEYLYQRKKKLGSSLRDYLFAHIGTFLHLGSFTPSLANFFLSFSSLFSWMGISAFRSLPRLAKKRFSKAYRTTSLKKKVVLFSDTFTEFTTPDIGLQAAQLLEKLGYEVIVPSWSCCGRTYLSKGFLEEAQKKAIRVVDVLFPYAAKGIAIIGLEPSCLLTIRDEYRDLHLDKAKLDSVIANSFTFDEFLAEHIEELQPLLQPLSARILLHTHCHQKALVGARPTLQVLKCIPNAIVEEIASGCCGMAGSFGYEKEHYAVSQQMAEVSLFPALRKAQHSPIPTFVVASGTSCRAQIENGVNIQPLHLAEILTLSQNV